MKKNRKKHTAPPATESHESVAALAGGMADDFNNILTTVMGACSLIDREDPGSNELLQYVAIIRASAERAATLAEKLTSSVAQEKDGGHFDNNSPGAGAAATSVRDKKSIHDIVPANNQTDGAKS